MSDYFINNERGETLRATEEQTAIIDQVRNTPDQNLMINALAGAAKTSTLQFLAKYRSVEPTLSLAFNKRIAEELTKRLPGHVKCQTMNSIGHQVWGRAVGKRLTLDTRKNYNLVKESVDGLPKHLKYAAFDSFSEITKALSRAKLSGYVPSKVAQGRSLLSADDFYGDLEEVPESWMVALIDGALTTSIRQSYAGLIDFDDQIYMPTLFGGSFPTFPRIMADEIQDFSRLNHAMLRKLVGPRAQVVGVGDPYQSIYAFRGAMTSSMAEFKHEFNCHEMGLSVSFRCAQNIVRHAHWRVPHMRWPEWAVEGTVQTLEAWDAKCIPDSSAIICRNNAPLLSCALALLRAGRGVNLVGTDLGPQLIRALKKLGDPPMPQKEVLNAIDQWEQEKLRKSRSPGSVADKAECLRVFASFGPDLGGAIAYAEHIFKSQGPIQLLSGHKSKGLEWNTVYHLDPHRVPSSYAKEEEELEQERNVKYVIETRAKRELYFVRMDEFLGEVE